MPDYLLDTTAIIDYLRDKGGVPELLERLCMEGGLLCCCPINIVEVYAGMKDKEKNVTDEFLNSLKCYETTAGIGILAGELKRKYAKTGITLSTADVLIAATAIKHHLTLVTNNAAHFPHERLAMLSYER
ncbi:MAG: type II toxin-antitoxin system VapC family toxin [Nitrospirae bacterium]|nr:type II toxin-antitoxin system VapC family toxin [Nitrospirota bacterium]MBI3378479.1 type II toxin-antitoxin system VapC family toxin [Nitrospirota bacterium]